MRELKRRLDRRYIPVRFFAKSEGINKRRPNRREIPVRSRK